MATVDGITNILRDSEMRGTTQMSHVWDELLLSDARNRKLVLIKTSDRRS